MRRRALVALVVIACSEDAGAGDAGGDAARPPDAATSGTLAVQLIVNVLAEPSLGDDDQPVDYRVTVQDGAGAPVDDAVVSAGRMGRLQPLAGTGGGAYEGSAPGWAPRFEVAVARGADYLTGAIAPSPSRYQVSLDPDPPRRLTAGEARWTPSGEPGVMAQVVVTRAGIGITHPGANGRDDGVELLAATAFPALGEYLVAITRSTSESFDSPGSMGLVQLIVRTTRTVSE
jgi:hypothetical protein